MKLMIMREKAGFSRAYVANFLDTTRVTIFRWEKGINEPDIATINALANLYDCTIDELIGKNPPSPRIQEVISAS